MVAKKNKIQAVKLEKNEKGCDLIDKLLANDV